MKYMLIPVLTPWYIYRSSDEPLFYNIICKNFDTGICRPTSLHVPSRLPRTGLHEFAESWPNSSLFTHVIHVFSFIVSHKCRLGISQEGVSGKCQNYVINDKIDLQVFP